MQLANLRRHRFGSKSEVLNHVIEQLERKRGRSWCADEARPNNSARRSTC
ncbi:MAG TPA: hypothetical protein VND94_09675 [Terriglobia bacterium]|nr:hypothetical protein [Terriglobia bacterium]